MQSRPSRSGAKCLSMIGATSSAKLVWPRPQVPSSATTCAQTTSPVAAPGMAPWAVGNSGYLLMGSARGAAVFQLGRRAAAAGGAEGRSTVTALIRLILTPRYPVR